MWAYNTILEVIIYKVNYFWIITRIRPKNILGLYICNMQNMLLEAKGPEAGFEPATEDPQSHMLTKLHYPGHNLKNGNTWTIYKLYVHLTRQTKITHI